MKKFLFFVLIISTAVLFVSCIPGQNVGDDGGPEQIVINTLVNEIETNVKFFAYKDGKSGDWNELTGSLGRYAFTPEAEDGNYSVFVVYEYYNQYQNKYGYDIEIINANKDELATLNMNFEDWTVETNPATINVNFSYDFLNNYTAMFYGIYHTFYTPSGNDDLSYELPVVNGTKDFVITTTTDYDLYHDSIYIDRDLEVSGEVTKNISVSDFVTLETFSATSTLEGVNVWSEILVGGETLVFPYLEGYSSAKIPNSILDSSDLHILVISENESDLYTGIYKYKNSVNSTEYMNTLPSSTWAEPVLTNDSNVVSLSWNNYDSGISTHETRAYQFEVQSSDYLRKWYITNTTGWLGSSNSYNYNMPDLSSLSGWQDIWYPENVTEFSFFSAITSNNSNFDLYFNPIDGYEYGYISK
ncbi:hypothetical protein [Geotoga petraea]|uniref:Carboxypeptidase regulatory-like domain-containing protein n=1 Tax=Geotoga petraea TaxID=28234 RepID=A0A4Z0W093_9BACT|nr:hypothetical protein [Geotoga petraea]TGG87909.1 hypothetical protein E4650_06095 [Geotoga petraea]